MSSKLLARRWDDMRSEMARSTARAFGTLYRRFQVEASKAYAARGWKDVTLAHVQFLMEIDEAGTRLSEVASALGTTRQYAGQLARELATRRLITLGADPLDGRAVLAKPTARGQKLFEDACAVRAELERLFLSMLTPARSAEFGAALADMLAALR